MPSGSDRLVLAALIGIVVLGGNSFVAIKFSDFELPPFWGAGIRFLVATLLLFLIAAARRIILPRGGALIGAVVYGVLSFGASYAFTYYALVSLNAGLVSVILSLVPIATLFLAAAHRQEHLSARGLTGGLVAITGTAIIYNEQLTLSIPLAPLLALLGAVLSIAETGVVLKHFPMSNPYGTNAIGMLIGSAILMALSVVARERWALPTRTATIIAVIYLVIFGSIVISMLYLFVISQWTASATNYGLVLIPIVTVIVASFFAGEVVTWTFLGGTAMVILGVYFGAIHNALKGK